MEISTNSIKNMRILHFEKIVPLELENDKNSGEKSRKEITFYTLGYYDLMTHVKAIDNKDTFDYNYSFLIKYPYKRRGQDILADQMISLLERDEDIGKQDPFEYEKQKEKPFLGIILVTLFRNIPGNHTYQTNHKNLLNACEERICSILKDTVFENDCSKIFYTPNCADLCVVIRTDNLNNIYFLKKKIAHLRYGQDSVGRCYTMSYTMIEEMQSAKDLLSNETFLEKNKGIEFELRITAEKTIMDKIARDSGGQLYGITGNGEYAVEINFPEFFGLYESIWRMKSGEEDKVPATEKKTDGTWTLLTLLLNNLSNIRCTYIRAKYPFEKRTEEEVDFNENRSNIAKSYEDRLKILLEKVNNCKKIDTVTIMSIRERIYLLKELTYTYGDFLFQKSSWWKGVLFYIQIDAVIDGINKYLCTMEEKNLEQASQRILTERLYCDINEAISSINNFNKLLQSMNQYIINVPNYEMQTKVNVEKYLMAYTMYLLEISNSFYFQQQKKKNEERVLPLFTIDRTESDIKAYSYFSPVKNYEEAATVFFSVLCPNYQWFANIYHVLPMITHEISHNFRFTEDRYTRNKEIMRYIINYMGKIWGERMIEYAGLGINTAYGLWEKFIIENMADIFWEICIEEMEDDLKNDKLKIFKNALEEKFLKISGINGSEVDVWDYLKKKLLELFKITDMKFCISDSCINGSESEKEVLYIFVNILIDLLVLGEDACKEWREQVKNINPSSRFKELIQKLLDNYSRDNRISDQMIEAALKVFVSAYIDKRSSVKSIKVQQCLEKLKEGNAYNCYEIILTESEKCDDAAQSEEEQVLEEIYHFCSSYLNIKGILRWDKGKIGKSPVSKEKATAEKIYQRLHGKYLECAGNINAAQNKWILYKENQDILTKMGIVSNNSRQFVDFYKNFINGISRDSISKNMNDLLGLYEEVFADLAMCEAFNFTASGYIMYTIHINLKERRIARNISHDMSLDRMCAVLFTKYEKTSMEELGKEFSKYWEDLSSYLRLEMKMEDILEKDIEDWKRNIIKSDQKDKKSLLVHIEMLKWIIILYRRIIQCKKVYKNDFSLVSFYKHINQVIQEIKKMKWIKKLQNDTVIKNISNYYNDYTYSRTLQENELGTCLCYQNQFVMDYYGYMIDYIYNIAGNINESDAGNLLNRLFEYELKGESN